MGDKDLQKEQSTSDVLDDMEFLEIPEVSSHSDDKIRKRMRICSIALVLLLCAFLLVLVFMEVHVYTESGIIVP